MPDIDLELDPPIVQTKRPNPLLNIVGIVATILILIVFAAIIGIGSWNDDFDKDSELIPPTTTQDPINTSCREVATEEIQSCCAQWAINNDMMLAQCVGSWQLVDAQCTFVCQNDVEGI